MMQADLLLLNGTIRTMEPGRPLLEELAVGGGRVLAVGDRAKILQWRGSRTEVLDLQGGCALPAFTDSHCHLNAYGLAMEEVDCSSTVAPTIEDLKLRITVAARGVVPGQWVQARGYDDSLLRPSRHPTRWDLDEAAPVVPVILRRRCGHVAVANSVALRMAGITDTGPEVPGGMIDRDRSGEATGVLRERAQDLVRNLIPPPDVDTLKKAILRASNAYLREGFCSAHDAGGRTSTEMVAYRELASEMRLPLRITLMIRDPWLEHAIGAGIATGFGDEWLKVGPCKLFADGGIGARTAFVSLPYQGETENTGVPWYPEEELTNYAVRAAHAGFAVAIHAIGDAAIRMAIGALARATEEGRGRRFAHRIEHCILPAADDLTRMRRLDIAAAVQPTFLYALGDSYLENLAPALAERCYPIRSMVEAGLLVTAGSDCPVVDSDPLRALQTLATRRTQSGRPIAAAEAVDMEQGLRMYTDLPPRLMGEEAFRGRLAPGMAADVVVLSADPLRTPAEDLVHLQVWATITGGEIRYRAPVGVQ